MSLSIFGNFHQGSFLTTIFFLSSPFSAKRMEPYWNLLRLPRHNNREVDLDIWYFFSEEGDVMWSFLVCHRLLNFSYFFRMRKEDTQCFSAISRKKMSELYFFWARHSFPGKHATWQHYYFKIDRNLNIHAWSDFAAFLKRRRFIVATLKEVKC